MASGRGSGIERILPLLVSLLIALASGPAFAQDDTSKPRIVLTTGHSGDVAAAAFSPDSRIVASASGDHTLKLWDVASGRELRTLTGHSREVDAVAFSPDGRTVVSSSGDGTVKLWDAASGRGLRTLTGHSRDVSAVAFSPDGRFIVSGSYDKTLKLWDAANGRELRTLKGHSREVNAVAFSPDGRTIASASWDKTIKLWDVASGRELRTLTGHSDQVTTVAFSPDGRTIVSGSWDKTLKLWDAASGRELHTLRGHSDWVFAAAFSPDGRFILSGGAEGALILWDTATGRGLGRERGHSEGVKTVAFSPDGHTFVSGSLDATLKLWDAANGHELRTLAGDSDDVSAVAFSPDGHTIASGNGGGNVMGSQDNSIKLWDATSGRELRTLKGHSDGVTAVVFSPDGRTIASASRDNSVKLWDAASGQELRTLTGHSSEVNTVAFSPDSRTVASGSQDTLILWDAASGRQLRTLNVRSSMQLSVAFSPDGRTVASGGGDGTVRLWDVASGRELRTLKGHANLVMAIAFSPDGRTIVSGGIAGAIKQWDAASGQEVRTLAEHAGEISALAFSPDGRIIASGGLLTLWDAASGRELRTFDGAGSPMTFSADGRTIVTGANHTLRRWDLEGKLLTTTIARTDGEWLTITPEGFFDASENGAKLLSVVQGLDVFSIDQFYDSLYRPDLVREKLAGDPRGLVREAAANLDLDKALARGLAPNVQLASPAIANGTINGDRIAVAAQISDRGGGIGRVEWRVNGVTAGIDMPPPGPAGQPVSLSRELRLDPGNNIIEAVAYSASNLIASAPTRLTVARTTPPATTEPTARPRLFVLAGGVNDYADKRIRLDFAVADANDVAHSFEKAGNGLYQSVEVTVMTDTDITRDKLDAAFKAMAGKMQPSDVFVLYLAAHGKTIDGRYYFIPQNFMIDGKMTDQSIDAAVKSEGITQEQLQRWFAEVPAHRSVILFDTCDSGTMTGDAGETQQLERAGANDRLARALGRSVITASSGNQDAQEGFNGHGMFTYELLDGLNAADSNGNNTIEVTELAAYVYAEVRQLSHGRQIPQMRITADYPLANRTQVLPDQGSPGAEARRSVYEVSQSALLQIEPGVGATAVRSLPAKAAVEVLESKNGWSLVARDGKPIGYVDVRDLTPAP